MSRPVPFLFCRYQFLINEELLDGHGQLRSLIDLQGRFFTHGLRAEREGLFDSVVMRPRRIDIDDREAIYWSVGQEIGMRDAYQYDMGHDQLKLTSIDDPSIRYSDFISIPSLGVLAVDDRTGESHMGGRAANPGDVVTLGKSNGD